MTDPTSIYVTLAVLLAYLRSGARFIDAVLRMVRAVLQAISPLQQNANTRQHRILSNQRQRHHRYDCSLARALVPTEWQEMFNKAAENLCAYFITNE